MPARRVQCTLWETRPSEHLAESEQEKKGPRTETDCSKFPEIWSKIHVSRSQTIINSRFFQVASAHSGLQPASGRLPESVKKERNGKERAWQVGRVVATQRLPLRTAQRQLLHGHAVSPLSVAPGVRVLV